MRISVSNIDRVAAARRRLAKSICARLNLPLDDRLAFVIGDGSEKTSEAAVLTWLVGRDVDPHQISLTDACGSLKRDLMDALDA
ncbi:MAG: hypothetical protein AAFR07_00675 [Pseudomonadota bacterium]